MNDSILYHHGTLGMKWGVRRFQNADGSLTELGRKRLERKDDRWATRNEKRITTSTMRSVKKDITKFVTKDLNKRYTRAEMMGRRYMNEYNQKLASLMNQKMTSKEINSPSGKVVRFVAKRGEVGVYMALATPNYDMNKVKNGVYGNGRVAYKQEIV